MMPQSLQAATRLYTHDDITMPYIKIGKGPVLLFLTGAWVHPRIYEPLIRDLSHTHTVIVPHIPPFGESVLSSDILTFHAYGVFFHRFLSFLRVRKISVVGHSLGAMIGLHLAVVSPLVTRVVVMNPPASSYRRIGIEMTYIKIIATVLGTMVRVGDGRLAMRIVMQALAVVRRNWWHATRIARIITGCLSDAHFPSGVPHIPVTILWGRDDEVLPTEIAVILKKKLPRGELILVPGHHNWCLVHQHDAANKVRSVLAGSQ